MLNITKSMELSNMIKESEWFCAIEGIAIAERIYNFYEGVSKHKIIKEKDSLYVFILAYNESLFFE